MYVLHALNMNHTFTDWFLSDSSAFVSKMAVEPGFVWNLSDIKRLHYQEYTAKCINIDDPLPFHLGPAALVYVKRLRLIICILVPVIQRNAGGYVKRIGSEALCVFDSGVAVHAGGERREMS